MGSHHCWDVIKCISNCVRAQTSYMCLRNRELLKFNTHTLAQPMAKRTFCTTDQSSLETQRVYIVSAGARSEVMCQPFTGIHGCGVHPNSSLSSAMLNGAFMSDDDGLMGGCSRANWLCKRACKPGGLSNRICEPGLDQESSQIRV